MRCVAFRARELGKSESYIALDCKPWENAPLLKDKDAARIWSVDSFAIDGDRSAGRGKEAAHHIQQRRLAASGRSEQADEFSLGDIEIDVIENGDTLAIAVEHHADVIHA